MVSHLNYVVKGISITSVFSYKEIITELFYVLAIDDSKIYLVDKWLHV